MLSRRYSAWAYFLQFAEHGLNQERGRYVFCDFSHWLIYIEKL